MKTRSENIAETLHKKRRIILVGFVARMEDTRLPEYFMFGEPEATDSLQGEAGK